MSARAPLAVVVAALAAPALAGSVDLQVRGKDKVSGTIRPAFDEECFLCELPRGAVLTSSVKGGKAGPAFRLTLRDGAGVEVPEAAFVAKGTGGALAPFVAAASGSFRVCVTSDGEDGDYQAAIAWKPQTSWQGTGAALAPAAADAFSFAAPAGASATVDVVPAKGSPFVASITSVAGPAGFDTGALAGSRASLRDLPATGEYTVNFTNAGAAAGDWVVRVKLKLAKAKKGKFDLRDGALTGAFDEDHTVYGRVLDEAGGVVTPPVDLGGAVAGSSVTIPAGVLGTPTVVTIAAADPLATPQGAHGAGPAVEFGPDGAVFDPSGSDPSKQATLTIPYDPAFFPDGTDSLRVYVQDGDGDVVLVPPPYTIDSVAFTVSFAVSHFSAYQAAATGPRPLVGRYLVLQPYGDAASGFSGEVGVGLHELDARGATADLFIDEAAVRWTNTIGQGAFLNLNQTFDSATYDVASQGDEIVTLTEQGDPTGGTTLRRGADDDVLVGQDFPLVALRRVEGSPTVATIAGKWHLFHYGFETEQQIQQGPPIIRFTLFGDTGTLLLGADQTVKFLSHRSVETSTQFPDGVWQPEPDSPAPSGLTWEIGDGSVDVRSPLDEPPIRFQAVLGGDVLIAREAQFGGASEGPGPSVALFVLVRAGSGVTGSKVAGSYWVSEHEIATRDRAGPPPGQGFKFRDATLLAALAANGRVSVSGSETAIEHDDAGEPIPPVPMTVPTFESRFSIRSDGGFSGDGGAWGAFARDGAFLIRLGLADDAIDIDFGTKRKLVSTK